MKGTLKLISVILCLCVTVAALAACNPTDNSGGGGGGHHFDYADGTWEWSDDLHTAYYVAKCGDLICNDVDRRKAVVTLQKYVPSTCVSDGEYVMSAEVSIDGVVYGDSRSVVIDSPGHLYGEWLYDTTGHWQECSRCSLQRNYGEHNFVNDVCTVCGKNFYSLMVTANALSNVITYIYDNTYKDVKFDGSNKTTLGIDVELDLVLGGETYTLVAKGNLDIRPEVTSKAAAAEVQDNSELYIGIKKGAKTLIGIGYDVEGTGVDNLKPYLYLVSTDDNGANPVVKKVHGMSIAEMMYENANIEYAEGTFATSSANGGGVDIVAIIKALPKLIGSTLFGSTCKIAPFGDGGTQYIFNFDLKNTITGLASGGITDLLSLFGDSVDAYIGPIVDGLKQLLPHELAEQVTGTGTIGLKQLLAAVAKMLGDDKENNVTGTFTFNFNKDKTFNSASIDIDASKFVAYLRAQAGSQNDEDAFDGKIIVNIDKLVLSNDVTVNVFEGTPLEGQITTGDANVTNILDFALEATAIGADDTYEIVADFDVNPFAFVDMMKYSAKQDTEPDGVIDGQAFLREKLVACLKNLGTAKIIVTKPGYGASAFDAAKAAAEGVVAGDVIIYANFDPSNEDAAVDLFIWNEADGAEVVLLKDSEGNNLFPMTIELFADKMIKDSTIQSGTPIPATSSAVNIGDIFGYIETFMPYLEPLFSSFSASAEDMSFTIKYASLISDVVMPVIAELAKIESLNFNTEWVDANLENLLAVIFGSVPEGGDALVPADEVVFTLESFEYAGTAIYPKAA